MYTERLVVVNLPVHDKSIKKNRKITTNGCKNGHRKRGLDTRDVYILTLIPKRPLNFRIMWCRRQPVATYTGGEKPGHHGDHIVVREQRGLTKGGCAVAVVKVWARSVPTGR